MKYLAFSVVLLFLCSAPLRAHNVNGKHPAQATYLGNEGVMVSAQGKKILFDPIFDKVFGIYQVVPDEMRKNVLAQHTPFDDIHAVFVSHAHGDHFAAGDVSRYLQKHKHVQLYAPKQAVDMLIDAGFAPNERIHAIDLGVGDAPWSHQGGELAVEAVRIPHSGWPGRQDVQNLVFRVQLEDSKTLIHMGDADVNVEHYLPYRAFWKKTPTDMAFPPYWFFYSNEGLDILSFYMHIRHSVGVHVPVNVPDYLRKTGEDFFQTPGEKRDIH